MKQKEESLCLKAITADMILSDVLTIVICESGIVKE